MRYFKGQILELNDNTAALKLIIKEILIEYKNYVDKVYGLKNLEKSFSEFLTEEFQKIILKWQKCRIDKELFFEYSFIKIEVKRKIQPKKAYLTLDKLFSIYFC